MTTTVTTTEWAERVRKESRHEPTLRLILRLKTILQDRGEQGQIEMPILDELAARLGHDISGLLE